MSCQTNKPLRNSPALRAELLRRVDNDQSVESTAFRQLIPADSTIDQELQSLPHTDNKQWWKRFRKQSAAHIRQTIAEIEAELAAAANGNVGGGIALADDTANMELGGGGGGVAGPGNQALALAQPGAGGQLVPAAGQQVGQ